MNPELKLYLRSIIHFESFSKKNDILCNIDFDLTIVYEDKYLEESPLSIILKKSKKIEKEIGINPLCKSLGTINLKDVNGQSSIAPVLLKEVKITFEDNKYHLTDSGDYFLNPYLFYALKIDDRLTIESLLDFKHLTCVKDLEIDEEICLLGNFHPYRFEVYRDLSEISQINYLSRDLAKLFMFEDDESESNFNLSIQPILQLDHHQKKALESLKSNSVLVHGPPGTGKSQLIGNAIGSALQSNLSILMSSEKKASIDAVYKRLEKVGLHRFCLVNYSKNENKLLIRDLKKTWDFLIKERTSNPIQFENKYPFSKAINEFISKPKIEGMSLKNEIELLKKSDYISIPNDIDFHEFKENEHILDSLNDDLFKLTTSLNFSEQWDEKTLTTKISECEKLLEVISPYHPIQTTKDVDQLVRNLLIIQGFSSGVYQKYEELICNKSNKIKRLHAEYIKIQKNKFKWEGRINHWIKHPSVKEIELLMAMASKKSLFERIKFKLTWKKWARTSNLDPISTCNEMLQYLVFQEQKNKFLLNLKELGIESDQELILIYNVTINHSTENWNWYRDLNAELRRNYKRVYSSISNLKIILNSYFNFKIDDQIIELFAELKVNKNPILNELLILEKIPRKIRDLLQKCKSINDLRFQIHSSLWRKHFENIEIPTSLIQKEWVQSALRYEKNKLQVSKSNSIQIIQRIKNKFDSYQKLIETPNRKLNAEEKNLKTDLKIGKNILIKEFGKVKQHIGLRKLYESEAKYWLLVLKPMLMMHPLRIATYFPPNPGLFDLGIIDEASQMPFKNSIGTLQRVKRVLIAGDDMQMDPSYFFTANDNEHSVFHQAKYHFLNAELTHHYRSESEELISFSNSNFYENKLRFIERANLDKKQFITHHFIENGNYNEGLNVNEAQTVCDFIIQEIQKIDDHKIIGIVAFSESQLKTIEQKIPAKYTPIIDELLESNRLFFKTLDQVQGDECDVLIISFGYGKNKDGSFEMRFGPINQQGGEKRLNVLFSRAKKEIHFFSSVKYVDFPQTKNTAVQLLKHWFALLENTKLKKSKSYEIHVLDILAEAKDVDDFTHLISIYHEKGWKILTS